MENLRFLNTVIELHRPMMTCNEHYIIMTFHYPLIESGFLLINDKKMKTELFNMNPTEAVFFVDYVRGPYISSMSNFLLIILHYRLKSQ